MLGDTFVLEVDGIENHPFRIAGTRLCALFGRELKGESFIKLWQRSGQTAMRELIAVVMEEKVGVVASVTGATADDTLLPVNLEMLLLPLAYQSRSDARVLGALAPMSRPLLARRQGDRAAHARHVPPCRCGGRCRRSAAVQARGRQAQAWPHRL